MNLNRYFGNGGVLCLLLMLAGAKTAQAAVYHVAQSTGADANDGSAELPFATITACANVAQAGDICRVHSGTYRETVSPRNSGKAGQPIRFEAAEGECPIISGAEPITAQFTDEGGNIWSAPLLDSVEQMFSNGQIIWEAQWPNHAADSVFDVPKATAAQGTGVTALPGGGSATYLVDPNIPDGDWVGARVYIMPGARWQSDSRPIEAYDASTHTITLDTTEGWAEKSVEPIATNHYYLYNSKLAMDTQDEWFWNKGTLYYFSLDNPAAHLLEYKKRPYALDIKRSYIEVVGFHVFAAAVRIAGHHITVDSLTIQYSSHLRIFDAYYSEGDVNRIGGDDNVWKNSLIDKAGSAGLIVEGNNNTVQNNVLTDVDYQGLNHAGIDMVDYKNPYSGNLFIFNTVLRAGRGGIFGFGMGDGRILYNKVSDYALLTQDMGGIYAWGTDGLGTEIAYNDVGNTRAFYGNGIYLDDATRHFVVHHNYVHDTQFFGAFIKEENYYFNNTFERVGVPFAIDKNVQNGKWEHTNLSKVQNNLTDGTLLVRVGLLPSTVKDYGYFETDVHANDQWQHVAVDFKSLYQPAWFEQAAFDLSSVDQIAFIPLANGDFEFDVDNIRLEGNSPLLVDDFESRSNVFGGAAWAGGSGDGTQSTGMDVKLLSGGTNGSGKYAAIVGTVFQGWDDDAAISWGNMSESFGGANLSAFTGLSFDIRGQSKDLKPLTILGNTPVNDHNASCTSAAPTVPSCAIDQGVPINTVTNNAADGVPDIGAYEAGTTSLTPGAGRSADPSVCGKIADITPTLPVRAAHPWASGTGGSVMGSGGTSSATGGTSASVGGHAGSPEVTGGAAGSSNGGGSMVETGGSRAVSGTAGDPGTGGNSVSNTGTDTQVADSGACGCRVPRSRHSSTGAWLIVASTMFLLRLRARNAQKQGGRGLMATPPGAA